MSDRTVPFDEDATCDVCGSRGAFDFVGDVLCGDCVRIGPDTPDRSADDPKTPIFDPGVPQNGHQEFTEAMEVRGRGR